MTTRMLVYGPNGAPITPPVGADLTGVLNTDSSAPLSVVVERECNMGHWHALGGPVPLPMFGPDDAT